MVFLSIYRSRDIFCGINEWVVGINNFVKIISEQVHYFSYPDFLCFKFISFYLFDVMENFQQLKLERASSRTAGVLKILANYSILRRYQVNSYLYSVFHHRNVNIKLSSHLVCLVQPVHTCEISVLYKRNFSGIFISQVRLTILIQFKIDKK